MFDRFGEFDSVEELNAAAEGQKNDGDQIALYALAKENGIDKEDAEDYWNGNMPQLATTMTAAFGRLSVLEQEEINTKNNPLEKMPLQVILTMLKGMCTEESMAEAVMKKGKRVSVIYEEMSSVTEKNKAKVCCGTDRELCEIIRAYFLESKKKFHERIEELFQKGEK